MRAIIPLAVILSLATGCGKKEKGGGDVSDAPKTRDKEAGANRPTPGTPVPEKETITELVEVSTVALAYNENEAAADKKYTGYRLTCEGSVYKVEKGADGTWMVSFEYLVDGSNMRKGNIHAYFPAEEGPKLAKLKLRDVFYFTGRCDGKASKSILPFVNLRDCHVIPPPKKP
jgi:hypothetical protein